MSTLIVMLDGAADERIPQFGNKTPLQAVHKRFIDAIASEGRLGHTEAKGYTHLFMLHLLGGSDIDVPRGVVEALGYGIDIHEEDICYRLSPATIHGSRLEWEYQLICEQDAKLRLLAQKHVRSIQSLNPRMLFYCQGKGILTVRSDTIEDLPAPPAPASLKRADFGQLDPFIRGMHSENGGMVAMPWGGGGLPKDADRDPLDIAKRLVFFSKSPSVLGVAAYFGLEGHEVSNYHEGLKAALPRLAKGDVFLHIEETDDISHKRSPEKKLTMLQDIDRLLIQNQKRMEGHRVAFVIDHGTSSLNGEHIIMPVPFAHGQARKGMKATRSFCENNEDFVPLSALLETLLE